MPGSSPIRRPLSRFTRRGLEAVFWMVFALAIGVGGSGAVDLLPRLGELVIPSAVFEAQASNPVAREIVSIPVAILHLLPATLPVAKPGERPNPLPAIAIVIDDMGGDLAQNRRAIALPRAVSLSFLPYPEYTPELAREARAAGHEVMAHVPMQAPTHDGSSAMALRIDLPAQENLRRLDWALTRVPGFAGLNNHEGSVFTADRKALAVVAQALYGRGVFFLDSRTTADTQVVPVSRAFGVPSGGRDVFLDDTETPEAIAEQLRILEKEARANGVAIAIGHPRAVTLSAVADWCARHPDFRLVPASTAIRLKTAHEWQVASDE